MGLRHRGVNYDTGTNYLADGVLSRQTLPDDVMAGEIRAIRDRLRCNAIGIYGTDLDRLVRCATVALRDGLSVWLQPRLINAGPQQTLAHLAEAARAAEELRKRYSAVTLNVGCELSIFSAGIIPGASYGDRGARLTTVRGWPLLPWFNQKLNRLLAEAATVARADFHGQVTYGGGLWERVDWKPFDIVGLDYYRVPFNRSRYARNLRRFHRYGKPVVIVEFGCGSFIGAADKGPTAHELIDWSGSVPQIRTALDRSERIQAEQIADMLDIYDAADVAGAFVFEFIEHSHPHVADPRYDLDMAGYGIVKVLPDDHTGTYRWEPKLAFHEIARRYGSD